MIVCSNGCRVERVEQERMDHDLLLHRLNPVDAGYDLAHRCTEGTRQSILSRILEWVSNPHGGSDAPRGSTYWLYGSPGIGKSSVAHSLCEKLHKRSQLAGAFFCQRDDPNFSNPKNIIPTLIYNLAITFPPFRSIVTERLRNDANLTSKSMECSLFLDFIRKVPHHPEHTLALVIDALDECGDRKSRLGILMALIDVAAQAPWLKIIITSRPEADIQRFFDAPTRPLHLRFDLGTDSEASADLRTFAQSQFDLVASTWYRSPSWPEESLFNRVTSRAKGLFIFIKTIALALDCCTDPTDALVALQDADGTGLGPLYGLYSSILKARIAPGDAAFQRVIGVILITAPYRSMCEETIGRLAGVKPTLVKKWVDDLSSLLYRDDSAKGGIRVRHPSISDLFLSEDGPPDYRVNLRTTNVELGIACLTTMVDQLRFNICKLEDSRLANEDVTDLQSRVEENIPDALQYSSLYWSHHLCFTPDNGDRRVWESLKEFFEGPYPLYWIEVLSIMGMVSIGAPSLRNVMSWAKVSGAPACHSFVF
jgi:hypothetical protein